MNDAPYVLALLGYLVMYALPQIFFKRDGKLNLRWWLTGAPFGIAPIGIALAWSGHATTLIAADSTVARALTIAAMPVLALSYAMVAATIATHKVPLALWHQQGDAPVSIVTYGPYRWVRHPFYVSFLLLLLGTSMVTREPLAIGSLVAALAILGWTARGEERRLLASELGGEYKAYLERTGRFVPRLSRAA